MDYGHLRAEYDASFNRLRAAASELRAVSQLRPPDKLAEEAARQCIDQAMCDYRACRERLANFLTPRPPAREPAVEVQTLAHRLWEEAGRPVGSANEHWFRAEEMLRSGQQLAS